MAALDDVLKKREQALARAKHKEKEEEKKPSPPSIATTCPHCEKPIALIAVAVRATPEQREPKKAENTSDTHPLLSKIEKMVESGLWGWAEDTLKGIYDKVKEFGSPTDRQEEAIRNIYRKGAEKYEREYGEELF